MLGQSADRARVATDMKISEPKPTADRKNCRRRNITYPNKRDKPALLSAAGALHNDQARSLSHASTIEFCRNVRHGGAHNAYPKARPTFNLAHGID